MLAVRCADLEGRKDFWTFCMVSCSTHLALVIGRVVTT